MEAAKTKEWRQSLPPPHLIPFSYPPVIAPQMSLAHRGDGVSLHYQPPPQLKSFFVRRWWLNYGTTRWLWFKKVPDAVVLPVHPGPLTPSTRVSNVSIQQVCTQRPLKIRELELMEKWRRASWNSDSFLPTQGRNGSVYILKPRLSACPSFSLVCPGDIALPCWLCQMAWFHWLLQEGKLGTSRAQRAWAQMQLHPVGLLCPS